MEYLTDSVFTLRLLGRPGGSGVPFPLSPTGPCMEIWHHNCNGRCPQDNRNRVDMLANQARDPEKQGAVRGHLEQVHQYDERKFVKDEAGDDWQRKESASREHVPRTRSSYDESDEEYPSDMRGRRPLWKSFL